MTARTLFEKVWDAHAVASDGTGPTVLYIDLNLVHEVTSPQAFEGLRLAGEAFASAAMPGAAAGTVWRGCLYVKRLPS